MNWALENSIETADSMKARGYGLKGRSSFSNYIFEKRDKYVLGIMMVLTFSVILGAIKGENTIVFFPMIKSNSIGLFSIIVYISYFLLCLTPVFIEIIENIKWKKIEKSKTDQASQSYLLFISFFSDNIHSREIINKYLMQ